MPINSYVKTQGYDFLGGLSCQRVLAHCGVHTYSSPGPSPGCHASLLLDGIPISRPFCCLGFLGRAYRLTKALFMSGAVSGCSYHFALDHDPKSPALNLNPKPRTLNPYIPMFSPGGTSKSMATLGSTQGPSMFAQKTSRRKLQGRPVGFGAGQRFRVEVGYWPAQ